MFFNFRTKIASDQTTLERIFFVILSNYKIHACGVQFV